METVRKNNIKVSNVSTSKHSFLKQLSYLTKPKTIHFSGFTFLSHLDIKSRRNISFHKIGNT